MYGGSRLTPGIKYLLIGTFAASIVQQLPGVGDLVFLWGALVPRSVFFEGQIWRLVTYMFLHGGAWHLLFNLFALWIFGSDIEEEWGTRRFLIFYGICGVGAGLLSFFSMNSYIIGASGAIFGVMTAFGVLYPHREILLFFVFPVPARIAVLVFFGISLLPWFGGGLAHWTHLGGIVVGFAYLKLYEPVAGYLRDLHDALRDRDRRRRREESVRKERYFEDVIDPILKKISQQGMESLTKKERDALQQASKSDRQRLKSRQIIPFELFRKGR